MKNLVKLFVVLIAIVTLNACSNSNTPEAVAKKYLDHMAKKEYDEAKKLATENSATIIDSQKGLGGLFGGEAKEAKVEDLKCKTEGDKATCTYKQDGTEKSIDLVKQNDKWLVELKKETPKIDEPKDTTATNN